MIAVGNVRLRSSEWQFLIEHRVARMATIARNGRPSIVPICYAADSDGLYSALDEKPKSVRPDQLGRVRNLSVNPNLSVVIDDYAEDWATLAYLKLTGCARLVEPGDQVHERAVSMLRQKYPQYRAMQIERRSIVWIIPTSYHAWSTDPLAFVQGRGASRRGLDFDTIVRGRRSVRAYTADSVPRSLVEEVLDAARWAPSPHGRMPWRFVVLTRPDLKDRLAEAMGDDWDRQLALDGQPSDIVALRKTRSQERIREAPVCVVLCLYLGDLDTYPDEVRQAAETTMAVQSLGAAAQNLLLAAYQRGLDGGWMCAPLFCQETVRAALDLSPDLQPHALLTLGYAARDPKRRERLPLDTLVVRYD